MSCCKVEGFGVEASTPDLRRVEFTNFERLLLVNLIDGDVPLLL